MQIRPLSSVICASARICRGLPGLTTFDAAFVTASPPPLRSGVHPLRHFVQQRAASTMNEASSPHLCLEDYDCIGFDLDNTLLKYNLSNVVKLEYDLLAHFLVEQKGYDATHLLKPIQLDFLQKGLILDYERGNVLQLASDGSINQASHGTRMLADIEIEDIYGKERISTLALEYTQNMLDAYNGPLSEKIRPVLDHFDVPAALAFARCVDNIDDRTENSTSKSDYNLYQDILDGLIYMYRRENFANNTGGFFSAIKNNPEMYLHQSSDTVCNWLKELKKKKIVFLVTGSHVDFASFTSEYCFGKDWRSLFNVVVTFARKPGFFTGRRPFISLEKGKEKDIVEPNDLMMDSVYSQGNWQDMYDFFKLQTKQKHPRCLYVGDNVIQDIFAPAEFTRCDAVAISQEMSGEGVGLDRLYADVLTSTSWGSYFTQRGGKFSLWCDLIQRHASVCVPNIDTLAENPLQFKYQTFKNIDPDKSKPIGFYPKAPHS